MMVRASSASPWPRMMKPNYINVDPIDLDNAGNMLAVHWINDGLQKMLQKGKAVAIRGLACGAAGRVLMLDAVRAK